MGVLLQLGRGELLRAKRERYWLLSFLTISLCPRRAKAAVAVLLPLPLLQLLLAARPTLAVAGTARRCGACAWGGAWGGFGSFCRGLSAEIEELGGEGDEDAGPGAERRKAESRFGRVPCAVCSPLAIRGPRGLGRLVEILGISENLYQ